MSIQSISGNASQAGSAKIPQVISNNATILNQQKKSILGQISMIQGKPGSAQQIQKLNQALQKVQQRLQDQGNTVPSQPSEAVAGSESNSETFDVKA